MSKSRLVAIRRIGVLFFLAANTLVASLANAAPNIGFRQLIAHDSVYDVDFPVGVWYPAAESAGPAKEEHFGPYSMSIVRNAVPGEGKYGLIAISHGIGGHFLTYRDLAIHLAQHGYVVVAPLHPKNNSSDNSGTKHFFEIWEGRPLQMSRAIDLALEDKDLASHIDKARIGAVGHSAGGYTVLAMAGAIPDMKNIYTHCATVNDAPFCSAEKREADNREQDAAAFPKLTDARIKAVIAMAPVGAIFNAASMKEITIPVRVYVAEKDDVLLNPYHGEFIHKNLPAADYISVRNAGHYSFIEPFPKPLLSLVGPAGEDPPGFDRKQFHAKLDAEITSFFDEVLKH